MRWWEWERERVRSISSDGEKRKEASFHRHHHQAHIQPIISQSLQLLRRLLHASSLPVQKIYPPPTPMVPQQRLQRQLSLGNFFQERLKLYKKTKLSRLNIFKYSTCAFHKKIHMKIRYQFSLQNSSFSFPIN